MGQQPSIPLTVEDLPRPEARPAPARRWRADRPGDLASPTDVPWGGAFGTPGPDTGYALRLLADRSVGPEESRALAAVMAARASQLGRAPVAADAEAAESILGLALPPVSDAGGSGARAPGHGVEGLRRLLESLDPGLLAAPLEELRRRPPAVSA
ncbi:MAG: hypothetical protein ABIJ48_12640 [Actinomycetota bacterium]